MPGNFEILVINEELNYLVQGEWMVNVEFYLYYSDSSICNGYERESIK